MYRFERGWETWPKVRKNFVNNHSQIAPVIQIDFVYNCHLSNMFFFEGAYLCTCFVLNARKPRKALAAPSRAFAERWRMWLSCRTCWFTPYRALPKQLWWLISLAKILLQSNGIRQLPSTSPGMSKRQWLCCWRCSLRASRIFTWDRRCPGSSHLMWARCSWRTSASLASARWKTTWSCFCRKLNTVFCSRRSFYLFVLAGLQTERGTWPQVSFFTSSYDRWLSW